MSPTVLECSWMPEREKVGRGRVDLDSGVSYWHLGPAGVYIDGGTLDLGIVRDSTLNSTNDFQVVGETFASTPFRTNYDKLIGTVDLRGE